MVHNKFLKYYILIGLLSLFNIFLLKLIFNLPFFNHVLTAVKNVLIPFFISAVCVYIFYPILKWIGKRIKVNPWVITWVLLALNLVLIIFLINFLIPIIFKQLFDLLTDIPNHYEAYNQIFENLRLKYPIIFNNPKVLDYKQTIEEHLKNNIGFILVNFSMGSLLNFLKLLWGMIIVNIIFIMMVKDYPLINQKIENILKKYRKSDWMILLKSIDKKLSVYVRGQLIIVGYMFIFVFIPLYFIGVPNALIFTLIIVILNIIPIIGPFLGAIPLGLYTLFFTPHLFIPSMLVIIISQQLDGNIGKPLLFGSKLDMHPLLVMFVLLTGGAIGSALGLIIALPIYIIISETYFFVKLKKKQLKINNS